LLAGKSEKDETGLFVSLEGDQGRKQPVLVLRLTYRNLGGVLPREMDKFVLEGVKIILSGKEASPSAVPKAQGRWEKGGTSWQTESTFPTNERKSGGRRSNQWKFLQNPGGGLACQWREGRNS